MRPRKKKSWHHFFAVAVLYDFYNPFEKHIDIFSRAEKMWLHKWTPPLRNWASKLHWIKVQVCIDDFFLLIYVWHFCIYMYNKSIKNKTLGFWLKKNTLYHRKAIWTAEMYLHLLKFILNGGRYILDPIYHKLECDWLILKKKSDIPSYMRVCTLVQQDYLSFFLFPIEKDFISFF